MPITAIVQLAMAVSQAVPQVISLIQSAKATATGNDLAQLEAAEAAIRGSNDAAHQRIQSST